MAPWRAFSSSFQRASEWMDGWRTLRLTRLEPAARRKPLNPQVCSYSYRQWYHKGRCGEAAIWLLASIVFATSPAITHVDYSARIQTVAAEDNPRFHRLLSEFERNTNCPVLVNTSFNVRGEPPVCTPEDAFRCFMRTEMDYLVLGNFVLDKRQQGVRPSAERIQSGNWMHEEFQKIDSSTRALRRFGFTLGIALLVFAIGLVFKHRLLTWPLAAVAAVLIAVAQFAPAKLRQSHWVWTMLSRAIGWFTTRVILTVLFFLVVTPLGLLQRLFGKRTIEVAFKADTASYWQARTASPMPEDYEKQF
jgi:carbamoyltransferase